MDNQRIFYSPKFIKDERVKKNIIKILGKNNILKNNSFKKNLINSKYMLFVNILKLPIYRVFFLVLHF